MRWPVLRISIGVLAALPRKMALMPVCRIWAMLFNPICLVPVLRDFANSLQGQVPTSCFDTLDDAIEAASASAQNSAPSQINRLFCSRLQQRLLISSQVLKRVDSISAPWLLPTKPADTLPHQHSKLGGSHV